MSVTVSQTANAVGVSQTTRAVSTSQTANAVSVSQTTNAASVSQTGNAVGVANSTITAHVIPDMTITDFTEDVLDWWARHPLNDANDDYIKTVISPTNIIDVQADYAGDLQDAIDALPATGGRLVLTPGTYDLANVTGISNVHFVGVGDASTIILRGVELWGGDDCATYDGWVTAVQNKTVSAMAIVNSKPRNFYFCNLTFNGDNNSPYTNGYGLNCRGVREVLVDDCTFTNYALYVPATHVGPVTIHGMTDNVYFRRCHFEAPGYVAVYADGIHGFGVIDCTFDDGFQQRVLTLVNDDFTCDLDGSGAYEVDELRQSAYNVAHGNTFTANGVGDIDVVSFSSFHALIGDNTINGRATRPFTLATRNGRTGAHYTSYDQHVIDNVASQAYYLVRLDVDSGILAGSETGYIGDATITGNTMTGGPYTDWVEYDGGTPVDPVTISGNIS